jgi:hypothetical protein
MSLQFKKDRSIFGEQITSGSITQLNKRKEIISKRVERSSDDILYLSSNVSWVRVTSSVDIVNDGGPKNAKKYQLFKGIGTANKGFVPTDTERTSYTESNEYGYIPIPGITNFEVLTQNDLGTLRSANITFTVHSPEDFSKLEQLYLRPGYSLLLEWGHSIKVNNDGTIDDTISYYPLDDFTTGQTFEQIKKGILALREKNSYNYDAMMGLIRNFSWSYNGINYLCSIDVVSNGEILESILNTAAPTGNKDDDNEDTSYNAETVASDPEKILNIIKTTPLEDYFTGDGEVNESIINTVNQKVKSELKKAIPQYEEVINTIRIMAGNLAGNGTSRESYWTKYIRLRDLLNIINFGSLTYDKDNNNIVKFYTTEEDTKTTFTTFDAHIGLDPEVCVLPKTGIHPEYHIPFSTQAKDLDETDLLNIFVNVNYILLKYKQFAQSEDFADNNIFDLINSILKGIAKNLGDINKFAIAWDDDTDIYYIFDTTVIPSDESFDIADDGNPKAYIDLVGLKAEVENLEFKSSITSDFSTLISLAAQSSSDPAVLENISNLNSWNEGLINRHQPEIKQGTTKVAQVDQAKELENLKIKFSDFLKECSYNNSYYLAYDSDKFNGYSRIHRHITRELLKLKTGEENVNDPGVIPFFLNFTIKGISGIKIFQSFKINEYFLPEKYKGKVGFIITGLDHKFTNGRWVTDIKSMIFPL